MLIVWRGLRVLVGLIAAWQCIGLLPVLTWFPRLNAVTISMVGVVLFKLIVLTICVAIFHWLGRLKRKRGIQRERVGDVALAGIVLFVGVIAIAIIAAFTPSNSSAVKLSDQASTPAGPVDTSQNSVGSIVGEWQCTDALSAEVSHLILHRDGSVSATIGSGVLFHDPWLRWYQPIQSNTSDRVVLLRLGVQGDNAIVVENPNNRMQNCVR